MEFLISAAVMLLFVLLTALAVRKHGGDPLAAAVYSFLWQLSLQIVCLTGWTIGVKYGLHSAQILAGSMEAIFSPVLLVLIYKVSILKANRSR